MNIIMVAWSLYFKPYGKAQIFSLEKDLLQQIKLITLRGSENIKKKFQNTNFLHRTKVIGKQNWFSHFVYNSVNSGTRMTKTGTNTENDRAAKSGGLKLN